MNSFKDKVVWITGASSGIGEALAYQFAEKGCKLILSARRKEELLRVKANCKTADVLILPFDLLDTSNIDDLTKEAIAHFSRIDILINNGGISQRAAAKDTSLDIDRKLMEVNFFSAVAITKSVLPYMITQKSGNIVVISSIAGKFGFFLRSSYSAAKHALHGFFESLRLEVEPHGIKVNIICPGKIKTNVSLNAITKEGKAHGKMDPSHEKGMSAEACAKQIVKATEQNKHEVLIGGKETIGVYLKRFLPGMFYRILRKQKVM